MGCRSFRPDKVPLEDGKTKVILLRTGEKRQGASSACSSPASRASKAPGCRCVSWASTQRDSRRTLISLYCSLAVLTHDALGVLDDVDTTKFHDYAPKYV